MDRAMPVVLLLLACACGGGGGDDMPDTGPEDSSAAECTTDSDCAGSLVCQAGACVREGCTRGAVGCPCADGDRCGRDPDGAPMMCLDGVCSATGCPSGTARCACLGGDECTDGSSCSDGWCVAAGCEDGADGCPCLAGTCDPGLYCVDGAVCADDDGYEGGPCLDNGRCYRGQRCDAALDLCVHCDLGREGCGCTAADGCDVGLVCSAGLCVSALDLPPSDPTCYTPCLDDLTVDGEPSRACSREGLMTGCVDDLTCVDGSCVPPGDTKPSCETDLDCPSFQACLGGGCYSNCEDHVDCPSGLGCHLKVCRTPCESRLGSDSCNSGSFCDAEDGETGFCMPTAEAVDLEPAAAPGGGFTLSTARLTFSNVTPERDVTIFVNDESRRGHTFTIRRLWHEYTDDSGPHRKDAVRDPTTGAVAECDTVADGDPLTQPEECPLGWLAITPFDGAPSTASETTTRGFGECTDGGSCPKVTFGNAGGLPGVTRWRGGVEISGNGGRLDIVFDYAERPDGQWTGTMHYFGSFDDSGFVAEGPGDPPGWLERADRGDDTNVGNALISKWALFRRGRMAGGWNEMEAILNATRTESWRNPVVADRCRALGNVACYPYTNSSGLRAYVSNSGASSIPQGVTDLPFMMNLRIPGATGEQLVGRIDSRDALHYPGDPAVSVRLASDPTLGECDPRVSTDCVIWLDELTVSSIVGGRFRPESGTCPVGFEARETPFLADGFLPFRDFDPILDDRRQVWCVDAELPFDTSGLTGEERGRVAAVNWSLAAANPVPDGLARRRQLRLLDGALVNQRELFFFFQETFDSFVDDADDPGVSAYGYVKLQRQAADLDLSDENSNSIPDAFEGNVPPEVCTASSCPMGGLPRPSRTLGAACDAGLLNDILGGSVETLSDVTALGAASVQKLASVLIGGTGARGGTISSSAVYWYCEDTGLMNGGADPLAPIACPVGSRVHFFTAPTKSPADIANLACQDDVVCRPADESDPDAGQVCRGGTCQQVLNLWRGNGIIAQDNPAYACTATDAVYCDSDRLDLRQGKRFYLPPPSGVSFNSLQADITSAFRYRTQFQSSTGSRVGFAPRICIPNSDQIPYCYDPPGIEAVRDRVDCLIAIYSDSTAFGLLRATVQTPPTYDTRSEVQTFLRGDFAQFQDPTGARDGFERLYSELLVMQGDEALTKAFASRFDLAGVSGAAFEGALMEPDGINLSGVAGFEMVNLYKAVQLYQIALDRLYSLGPDISGALARNSSVDAETVFISAETVTYYLERLIRASTQKARAYSEIASRYQNFNRPDLARRVTERAYTAAYLEAAIIQQLMLSISDRALSPDKPQIELAITQSQRRYRMALLDMRDLYASITDNVNFFGFAPDYIPFPALDESSAGRNAFEVLMGTLRAKVGVARVREQDALASNRSFQTDAATFQSELVDIRNNYDGQLGELCGTFEAEGRIYPATRNYAALDTLALRLGDPCGRMGNGQIHEAIVQVQLATNALALSQTRLNNLMEEVDIERERVSAHCDELLELRDYQYRSAGEARDLATDVSNIRLTADLTNQAVTAAANLAAALVCVPELIDIGKCAAEPTAGGVMAAAAAAMATNTGINEGRIIDREAEIADIRRDTARWETESRCDLALIDSNARTATQLLGLKQLELELMRGSNRVRLAFSEIGRLYNKAQRMQDEQEEAASLLIDVESARNDPNVRVYRNDAIINADIAFEDAIRAAYRATKVFEYYTSQSYARQEQLFLIRMVTAGDYNLDNYVVDLENAFYEFEEAFGSPDTRVLQLSLMDDIMRIPTMDDDGVPLRSAERISMLRERLGDVDLIDENGYVTMGFATSLERLSPLTRNHKIHYVEAEMVGGGGDNVARLYLRQAGTGVVRGVDDETNFFVFPERTAVINPFFGGSRVFSPEVYQSQRLRDRPLVNTNWELVLNQRDEIENRDLRIDTISDIRLYVYYTDFTVF